LIIIDSDKQRIYGMDNADSELFQQATEAEKQENHVASAMYTRKLIEKHPNCAIFRAFLANSIWDMGNLEEAEKEFKIAINLEQKNEKISEGYFHLLLELERDDDAFDEMRRFLRAGGKFDRYQDILDNLNERT